MRRLIEISFVVLAIAALAWASSEPWKDKPYQQWDEKDVQRVLSNSPWARTVQVDAKWQSAQAEAPEAPLPQGSSAGGGSSSGGGGARAGGGMGGGGGMPQAPIAGGNGGIAPQGGGTVPQVPFAVRWFSSRTMREAFVRNAILAGNLKPEDAEKELAQPVDTYQVLISGPQMTPFQSAEENAIRQEATLTTKKGKQKIEASKVEIQRDPDGKTIRGIVVSFPKKTATGEATIGADEKGAEFVLASPGISIKTSFDFSKMYDAQGRDL
jgi:hypothetical protein